MARRRFPLPRLLFWATFFYLCFDGVLFRTGYYYACVEPESTIGSIVLNRTLIQRRMDPSRPNILVLGDSRIAEGFSAQQANALTRDANVNYIGCGISGSTPRIWRYFLRWVDPDRKKFSAIVLMATAFTDDEIYEDLGNRAIDINYCVPLLALSDLGSFPATFSRPQLRVQARWAGLFPLILLQKDATALVTHPITRARKSSLWRSGYPEWIDGYTGRPEAMPGLRFLRRPVRPESWAGIRASLRPQLEGYFAQLSGSFQPLPAGVAAAYRRTWYGEIAADYAATGVPVYVFVMPRGPYHAELMGPTPVSGSFAGFAGKAAPRLLDPQPFYQLEVPANFFDEAHLNAVGRALLTRCLVQELARQPR